MAHEVLDTEIKERKQKRYSFKFPNLSGRFGISLSTGKKEFFLGIAVADIQTETVTRKRKSKVFMAKSAKTAFVEI